MWLAPSWRITSAAEGLTDEKRQEQKHGRHVANKENDTRRWRQGNPSHHPREQNVCQPSTSSMALRIEALQKDPSRAPSHLAAYHLSLLTSDLRLPVVDCGCPADQGRSMTHALQSSAANVDRPAPTSRSAWYLDLHSTWEMQSRSNLMHTPALFGCEAFSARVTPRPLFPFPLKYVSAPTYLACDETQAVAPFARG